MLPDRFLHKSVYFLKITVRQLTCKYQVNVKVVLNVPLYYLPDDGSWQISPEWLQGPKRSHLHQTLLQYGPCRSEQLIRNYEICNDNIALTMRQFTDLVVHRQDNLSQFMVFSFLPNVIAGEKLTILITVEMSKLKRNYFQKALVQ